MKLSERIKAAWGVLNGYHMQFWSPERRFIVDRSDEAKKVITEGVRTRLLDWSREMERKDPLFNRFLELCEQYVIGPCGLRIVSGSADPGYAARANAEWESWQPWCDISSRFGFGQRQGLIEREVEVAGEVFIYLTFGSSGRPRIQILESESICTPTDERAKDRSIHDGVRLDDNNRPLSYFAKTFDYKTNKHVFTEIEAASIVHIFEPSRVSQVRGLPIVYAVLKDMVDLQELQNFEMGAAKDAARTSKVIKTKSGNLPAEKMYRMALNRGSQNAAGTATTATKSEFYQTVLGSETVVLQTNDEMEQFASNRPSVAVQSFWDFVAARTGAGLGLPIEILIMKSMQGTVARGAYDMANSFFRCRSASRAEQFGRIWEHVIGNSIPLRRNQPADWRKIAYTPPRSINVDVGRNSAAMINELKVGATNFDLIYSPLGLNWQTELTKWIEQRKFIFDAEDKAGLPHVQIGDMVPPPPEIAPVIQ